MATSTTTTTTTTNSFSLNKLISDFSQLHKETNESIIQTRTFTDAYRNLSALIGMLGSGMVFVTNDINSKIASIENVCFPSSSVTSTGTTTATSTSPTHKDFINVIEMMDYEKKRIDDANNNFTSTYSLPQTSPLYPIGSKDLLRLVRALELVYHLLNRLATTTDELGECTRKAYNDTISKFHPYLVKKSVSFACYLLPYKKTFFQSIRSNDTSNSSDSNSKEDEKDISSILLKLSEDILPVYKFLHQSFVERNMDSI